MRTPRTGARRPRLRIGPTSTALLATSACAALAIVASAWPAPASAAPTLKIFAATADGGPATARVRFAARASRAFDRVALYVNGQRRWTDRAGRRAGRRAYRRAGYLRGRALRPGRNRLTVKAWRRAGGAARATRVVRIEKRRTRFRRRAAGGRRGNRDARGRRGSRLAEPTPRPSSPSSPVRPSPGPPTTPGPARDADQSADPSARQPQADQPPSEPENGSPAQPSPTDPEDVDPPSPPDPAPSPAPPEPPTTEPTWTAGFESTSFSEWSWFDRSDGGTMYAADAAAEGIDAHGGASVARFGVTSAHQSRDTVHSKLYKNWALAAPETGWRDDSGRRLERLPGDSPGGTYSAWFYLPRDYSSSNEWANIFQFKESYLDADGDWRQDPQWWLNVTPASSWSSPPAGASGREPVLVVNNWGGARENPRKLLAAPTGRWFEVRADLIPGERIDWYVDGQLWQSSPASRYPVGVSKERAAGWVFGVGHYGGLGHLWVDDVSFTAG